MLYIAAALGVSPLTLLSPAAGTRVLLSEARGAEPVSGHRFREWLLGRRPLDEADADGFINLPNPLEQTEEWRELQALAAEAAWASQAPDIGYAEAIHHQRQFQSRLELLLEQLELTARTRDPEGAARLVERAKTRRRDGGA